MSSDWQVIEGDCIERMREMPEASVDAIVCDPPYGLEFMGKDWERFAPEAPTRRSGWDQAQAGAKLDGDPSAPHGRPAFGKRRGTYRCSGCGKRDAFRNEHGCDGEWVHEWVDPLPLEALSFQEWSRLWAVEALRVLKPGGHLLAFGGTRTHHRLACAIEDAGFEIRDCIAWMYGSGFPKSRNLDGDWQGWGTALKPAHEPIVVARKPLIGTVAENVQEHGTGALNIDGCRIGSDQGRWPANVALDPEAAAMLDAQSGGASRFFYCAKASRGERNAGLQAEGTEREVRNHHPTVKPIELMRYLCRLVAAPGAVILDPFAGSGTTGCAVARENNDPERAPGWSFIGIEREAEYAQIARSRIAYWDRPPEDIEAEEKAKRGAQRKAKQAAKAPASKTAA